MSEKKKFSDQMTVVLPNVRIMTEPRPIPGTDNAVSACIALNTWSTGDEGSKLVQFVAKGKHAEFLTAAGKGARAALTFNGPGPQATVGKDGKTYYKIDYLVGMQIHRQAQVEQPEPAEEPDDAPPPPPAKKAGRFGTRAI